MWKISCVSSRFERRTAAAASTENLFHAGSDTVPGHCGRQTCINVTMSFLDSLPLIRGALSVYVVLQSQDGLSLES